VIIVDLVHYTSSLVIIVDLRQNRLVIIVDLVHYSLVIIVDLGGIDWW